MLYLEGLKSFKCVIYLYVIECYLFNVCLIDDNTSNFVIDISDDNCRWTWRCSKKNIYKVDKFTTIKS